MNKRNVTAGAPRQRAGYPVISLPTQSTDDLFIIEDPQFREGDRIPELGAAHLRSPDHKLKSVTLTGADETFAYYRLVFMKDTGKKLLGQQVDGSTWGEPADIETQRVPHGTPAESGFLVASSTVEPRDAQNSDRRTVKVGEWPVLYGTVMDEMTGIAVDIEKTYVPNGTKGGVIDGWYIEVSPYDKYKAIQIKSKVAEPLPAPETFPIFENIGLPSTLEELKVVWDTQGGGGADSNDTSASARATGRVMAVLIPKIKDGQRGIASGEMTRSYHLSIPEVTEEVTKIQTSSGMAYAMTKYVDRSAGIGSKSISVGAQVGIRTAVTDINSVLTNGVAITGDLTKSITDTYSASTSESKQALATYLAQGSVSLEIPASTPLRFNKDDEIVVRATIKKLRLGVYEMEVYKLKVP